MQSWQQQQQDQQEQQQHQEQQRFYDYGMLTPPLLLNSKQQQQQHDTPLYYQQDYHQQHFQQRQFDLDQQQQLYQTDSSFLPSAPPSPAFEQLPLLEEGAKAIINNLPHSHTQQQQYHPNSNDLAPMMFHHNNDHIHHPKPNWLVPPSAFTLSNYDLSSSNRVSPFDPSARTSPFDPLSNRTSPFDPLLRSSLFDPRASPLLASFSPPIPRTDLLKKEFRTTSAASVSSGLTSEQIANGEKRAFPCIFLDCKKNYTTGAGLRYHLHNFHNSPSPRFINRPKTLFACNRCSKSYVTKAGLRYHKSKAGHADLPLALSLRYP